MNKLVIPMRTLLVAVALTAAGVACKRTPAPSESRTIPAAAVAPALHLESRSRQGSLVVSTRLRDAPGELALVSDEDDHAVLLLDVPTGKVIARAPTEGRPAQILVLESGKVAVAMRDEARVATFDLEANDSAPYAFKLVEQSTLETAPEPIALALSPAGKADAVRQLYVATGQGRTLEQFELPSNKKRFVFEIAQGPRAVVALDDGTVVVAHANAGVLTKIQGAYVVATRLDQGEVFSRQGFALAAIGNEVFAPDTLVLPEDASASMRHVASGYGGGTVCEQEGFRKGWALDQKPVLKGVAEVEASGMQVNREKTLRPNQALAKVVASDQSAFAQFNALRPTPSIRSFDCVQVMSTSGALRRIDGARALVTQMGTACILPRAAAASEVKHEVYVACLGSNRIEAVGLGDPAPARGPMIAPKYARGWNVPKGPLGLAADGNVLLAWSQFDHSLSRIDLDTGALTSVAIEREQHLDQGVALGRELFYAAGDTRIAQDGRACANCHPDGLSDGIGWATPEGRRKPMLLAGRIGEGPFGWRGEHKTLREHLSKTIARNLHGTGLPEAAMLALESYVRALPRPPSSRERFAASALRGKQVFANAETGCAGCHHPDHGFTDGERHDVGTGGSFRTPPLINASAATPYMHEGKYAQLEAFLKQTEGKMGHTAHLSEADFTALVSYVQTL
jgi:mono/diheme cytochrome c family protein